MDRRLGNKLIRAHSPVTASASRTRSSVRSQDMEPTCFCHLRGFWDYDFGICEFRMMLEQLGDVVGVIELCIVHVLEIQCVCCRMIERAWGRNNASARDDMEELRKCVPQLQIVRSE